MVKGYQFFKGPNFALLVRAWLYLVSDLFSFSISTEDENGTWFLMLPLRRHGWLSHRGAAVTCWWSWDLIGSQVGMGECFQGCSDFISVSWPQLPQLTVRSSSKTPAFVRSTVCIISLQPVWSRNICLMSMAINKPAISIPASRAHLGRACGVRLDMTSWHQCRMAEKQMCLCPHPAHFWLTHTPATWKAQVMV